MSFKRPLSNSSSPTQTNDKKSSSILDTCKVCGDKASIKNYGARSCQSCKIFFRRNGSRPELVHQCQYDSHCQVNILTRSVCTSCRLTKCFSVGMQTIRIRKEVYNTKKFSSTIISNNIQLSKSKVITNVSQLPTLNLLRSDYSSLTNSDWTLLSNIVHAYDRYTSISIFNRILKNLSSFSCDIDFDISNVLNIVDSICTSVQLFISCTPDFQVLTTNEQQSLFQRNFHGISSFSSNIIHRDTNFFDNPKCYNTYITIYGLEKVNQTKHLIKTLDFDSVLLKVMVIIINFSSNCFIANLPENFNNDSFIFGTYRLFGSQNVYVELLWKYMIYQYGYSETVIRFAALVKCILDNIRLSATLYMNNDLHHKLMNYAIEKMKDIHILSENSLIPLWGKTIVSN